MNTQLAERMNHIKGSVIRQFAEAALKPGLITFANGNPSPVTFPVEEMKRFYQEALESGDNSLFIYGAVMGYPPLVQALKDRLAVLFKGRRLGKALEDVLPERDFVRVDKLQNFFT